MNIIDFFLFLIFIALLLTTTNSFIIYELINLNLDKDLLTYTSKKANDEERLGDCIIALDKNTVYKGLCLFQYNLITNTLSLKVNNNKVYTFDLNADLDTWILSFITHDRLKKIK